MSERPLLQLFFARSVACALPSPACTLLPILSVALAPACLYSLYSPSRLFLLPSLLACTLLPISAVVLTRLSVLCAPSHLLIVPLACLFTTPYLVRCSCIRLSAPHLYLWPLLPTSGIPTPPLDLRAPVESLCLPWSDH